MRVLLYAEACNPQHSSEPGFNFRNIRAIVDHVDEAVIATQIRNRTAIKDVDMGGADVVYIDTEFLARPLWKVSSALKLGTSLDTAMKYPTQVVFERMLWKKFRPALERRDFDIVHRIGPISSALASPLARWSPVPFVIGPVNGGLHYAPRFSDVLRRENEWLRYVRRLNKVLPYVASTYRDSAAILAAFEHTIKNLPAGNADRIIDVPEIGADPTQFTHALRDARKQRLDFVFVGRLVPFKCVDVAIKAFAESDILQRHRLTIIGDGPERAALEALVDHHGLNDCVTFAGWMPHDDVASLMGAADVFVFPSVKDSGAGVVTEAMMAGMVPVALNYGPTKHVITDASGIRVPVGSRDDHVVGFRDAMEDLIATPAMRIAMGQAARDRAVEKLSWDARARHIVEIYRWVLGQRPDKPKGLLED